MMINNLKICRNGSKPYLRKRKQIEEHSNILNVNLYQNEPQTDDTPSCNDNNNDDKTINGDMIAGRVDNADDVKKNLTSLTSNDNIKYIIDLLDY